MSKHRVVLTFDDGVYAKLICPDDGSCHPASRCSECGRDFADTETKPCYDCTDYQPEECWVKGWFDNMMATELLHGEVTVEIEPHFEWDVMQARIVQPASVALSEEDRP